MPRTTNPVTGITSDHACALATISAVRQRSASTDSTMVAAICARVDLRVAQRVVGQDQATEQRRFEARLNQPVVQCRALRQALAADIAFAIGIDLENLATAQDHIAGLDFHEQHAAIRRQDGDIDFAITVALAMQRVQADAVKDLELRRQMVAQATEHIEFTEAAGVRAQRRKHTGRNDCHGHARGGGVHYYLWKLML